MDRKLFLGIADNNQYASVVVGDSSGHIITTGVGGSVNYHNCGIEQARVNLQNIINQIVGYEKRSRLAGVCFTYKSDFVVGDWEMMPLISGFFEETNVQVEDFATSCTLGIHVAKERLLLVGGQTGFAVFQAESGQSQMTRHRSYRWNPYIRLNTQRKKVLKWGTQADLDAFLHMKTKLQRGEYLFTLSHLLDEHVNGGSSWAIEVASEVAHDLILLVMNLANHFENPDPIIGFCGPILLGSQTICQRVEQIINLLFPQCEIRQTPFAPAKGACLSSLLTRRSDKNQEVISNFYSSARRIRQKGWLDFVTNIS